MFVVVLLWFGGCEIKWKIVGYCLANGFYNANCHNIKLIVQLFLCHLWLIMCCFNVLLKLFWLYFEYGVVSGSPVVWLRCYCVDLIVMMLSYIRYILLLRNAIIIWYNWDLILWQILCYWCLYRCYTEQYIVVTHTKFVPLYPCEIIVVVLMFKHCFNCGLTAHWPRYWCVTLAIVLLLPYNLYFVIGLCCFPLSWLL